MLCGQGFEWVQSDGNIPEQAFEIGYSKSGEALLVGRTHFQGSLTPGKIHRSHGCLYIPFGGVEHSFQSNYEVLIRVDVPTTPPPDQPDNSDQGCCCSLM